MMRLMFVGDGPLDWYTIPRLVETILQRTIEIGESQQWAHLRKRKGYEKKLLLAMIDAVNKQLDGVVATVDTDKDTRNEKLKRLQSGRASARTEPSLHQLPVALGEATPHAEAWLLDDPKAVRDALALPSHVDVPHVINGSPKGTLQQLWEQAIARVTVPESWPETLAKIAAKVDPGRANHKKETGFAAFIDDVEAELGPFAAAAE